jgi:hypothetical protein
VSECKPLNAGHPLYLEHPEAALEHMHASVLAEIVAHPHDGLLACLPPAARDPFLAHVQSIVLFTDMAGRVGPLDHA